jgi:predicted nucleic acid-binding Zn ribbon protein
MTYLYESVSAAAGEVTMFFEIEQSVTEMPLTRHPETGVAIRRVILGGWGLPAVRGGGGSSEPGAACDCGPAGCC